MSTKNKLLNLLKLHHDKGADKFNIGILHLLYVYERKKDTAFSIDLLKDNGFVWGLTSDEQDKEALMGITHEEGYVYDDGEVSIKYQPDDRIWYTRSKDGFYSTIEANIKSVADLEDLFDLCGIEKEIES